MRQRYSIRMGLALGAVGLVFVTAEAGLRIGGFSHASLYAHDQRRGWALRPNIASWVRTEAGRVLVRTSSAGLRDREHAREKPAGTVRIAVLGDSFAEALQVAAEQTFWAVLERELGRCPAYAGRTIEVMNFGVGGYGTAQELLTLRDQALQYGPDLVLLAFYTENDVLNNARASNPTRPDDTPYFAYRNDRLVLEEPGAGSGPLIRACRLMTHRIADIAARLRVVQLAQSAVRTWTQDTEARAHASRMAALGVHDPEAAPYLAPTHPGLIEAWRVTEGLLVAVRDAAQAHGATPWIATLSNSPQVYPDPGVRGAFMRRVGADDLLYSERRILALGAREQIPVIALAIPLAEYADRHRAFLHGFPASTMGVGHWNETGHRLAGELIARRLCAGASSER
jgi:hypothetical protein